MLFSSSFSFPFPPAGPDDSDCDCDCDCDCVVDDVEIRVPPSLLAMNVLPVDIGKFHY
jgi:hypothetical protein